MLSNLAQKLQRKYPKREPPLALSGKTFTLRCDGYSALGRVESSVRSIDPKVGSTRAWKSGGPGTSRGSSAKVRLASLKMMTKNAEHAAACLSLHQGADHGAGVEAAQVVVGLTRAHEHNRLAGDVSHGDGCTDLQGGGEHDA